MIPHDILTLYAAKPVEYLIAVAFLLLFIPFWRFLNARPAVRRAVASKPARAPRFVEWFALPENVYYHPGHAWARVEADGHVTIGMDDFARKLVGPPAGVRLPAPGTRVEQGEPGWTLLADERAVDMLSPVDGVVVEANGQAFRRDHPADPYGRDWLLKVRPERLAKNLKHLIVNGVERRWMELNADALRLRLSPQLGLAYQDGGVPIDGLARTIDPDRWDDLAREFFLTREDA